MFPYIIAMLVYMEHNGDGALYRDISINPKSRLKRKVYYMYMYIATSDKLRVKAISAQAGIKWVQVHARPMCSYGAAVYQIRQLVCTCKARDIT